MSNYASPQSNRSRQLFGIAAVVILHAFLFYAINTGLAKKFVKIVSGPVEAKLIEETKPDLPPPPPPPPPDKNVPPPPPPAHVPPAEVQTSAPAAVNAIAAVTTAPQVVAPPVPTPPSDPAPTPPPPPAPAPVLAPMVRVAATTQCSSPEYPSASRRDEEEGVAVMRITVEADGSVSDASIEKSSGFARLDEAARKTAIRCKTKPATLDGKPEKGSARASFTFRLE